VTTSAYKSGFVGARLPVHGNGSSGGESGACVKALVRVSIPPAGGFKSISDAIRGAGLWCVPLDPDSKQPLVPWKHLQELPPTDAEVLDWCELFHLAGIGIPTGRGNGILVVDADSADAIEWLEIRGMPDTWLVRTRRGLHYYFAWPVTVPTIRNSASALAPGVDIRAQGGMVTGPGTRRRDGFVYEWDIGHSPADLSLAEVPEGLLSPLLEHEKRKHPATEPTAPRPYTGTTSAWGRKAFRRQSERARGSPGRYAEPHPVVRRSAPRSALRWR
jgi:Bifunctional DNA primase/polymerase, N-terminal